MKTIYVFDDFSGDAPVHMSLKAAKAIPLNIQKNG